MYLKSSYSNQHLLIDTQHHYVLVMFVVGLFHEDGIVVDMLVVHDLLVEDLNLAKISWIPDSMSKADCFWAKISYAGQVTSVNMLM